MAQDDLPREKQPEQPGQPRLRSAPAGRYVRFLPIGEGGMGVVYRAHDTELQRAVALKIARAKPDSAGGEITPSSPLGAGCPDEEARGRLLQEAWITGALEHPGIVPVHELGEMQTGAPYYTMRLVPGQRTLADTIEELCTDGVDARLPLLESFLRICDAVAYAHSRGIVHRDLKSRNVAVGEYGEVFVLDWGLARLHGEPESGPAPWREKVQEYRESFGLHTIAGALGTPGSMSPEAARGDVDAVDERSDLYGLGVMLYEILTGRRPFPAHSLKEYTRQVNTEDPKPASSIDKAVPAELSALCARALHRDPEQRFAGVGDLALAIREWQVRSRVDREIDGLLHELRAGLKATSDLSSDTLLRHLEPLQSVCARILDLHPEHAEARQIEDELTNLRERGIRGRVTTARRRLLTRGGAAILVLSAVVSIVFAGVLKRRGEETEAARNRAVAERESADGVVDFLLYDLRPRLDAIGRVDVLAELAEQVQAYYESLPASDASAETRARRVVSLTNLGDVFRVQGSLPEAARAYEAAETIAAILVSELPDAPIHRLRHAVCSVRAARVRLDQGERAPVAAVLTVACGVLTELGGQVVGDEEEERLRTLAEVHLLSSRVHRTASRFAEAEAELLTAAAIGDQLAPSTVDPVGGSLPFLNGELDLATVLESRGRHADAVSRVQDAEQAARVLVERNPKDIRARELLARCLGALGRFIGGSIAPPADKERALAAHREALEIAAYLAGLDPANHSRVRQVMRFERLVGDSLLHMQRLDEARVPYERAYEETGRLAESDPTNADWRHDLVTLCDRLARIHRIRGDIEQAVHYRERAVVLAEELCSRDPDHTMWQHILAFTLFEGGRELEGSGDVAAGLACLQRCVVVVQPLARRHTEDWELQVLLYLSGRHLLTRNAEAERFEELPALWNEVRDHLQALAEGKGADEPAQALLAGWLVAGARMLDTDRRTGQERAIRLLEEAIERATAKGTVVGSGESARPALQAELRKLSEGQGR